MLHNICMFIYTECYSIKYIQCVLFLFRCMLLWPTLTGCVDSDTSGVFSLFLKFCTIKNRDKQTHSISSVRVSPQTRTAPTRTVKPHTHTSLLSFVPANRYIVDTEATDGHVHHKCHETHVAPVDINGTYCLLQCIRHSRVRCAHASAVNLCHRVGSLWCSEMQRHNPRAHP